MKQFYLISLLFYFNSVTCYYNEEEHSRRHIQYQIKKNGRYGRNKDRVNNDFDRNAVQQFDLASFIQDDQKEIDDPYGLDGMKSQSLDKEDYNSEFVSDDYYKPLRNYPSLGPDTLQLIDSDASRNMLPTHMDYVPKYKSFGDDEFRVGRSKISDANTAGDKRKHKKGFLKKVKFPFFSRDPNTKSGGVEKKRKLFCMNCDKKNGVAGVGTNIVNSSKMEKDSKLHHKNISFRRARGSMDSNADTTNDDSSAFENLDNPYLSLSKQSAPREDTNRFKYLGFNYGNKDTSEDSNNSDNQKTKTSTYRKRCDNPSSNNAYYNVTHESSQDTNPNEDNYMVIKIQRSFVDNLCDDCKKQYLDNLSEDDGSRNTNIIHNSRQFFEKMFSMDADRAHNKTGFANRREKRDSQSEKTASETDKQLQELDLIEKRVESVMTPNIKHGEGNS